MRTISRSSLRRSGNAVFNGSVRIPSAAAVRRRPERVDDLIRGLGADTARERYGCAKVLRSLAEERPDLLYPRFRAFVDLLDHEKRILRWEGIHVIGHLAAVDRYGKVTRILDRYLAPLKGPELITAANVVGGAARIAVAKPRLAPRIAKALLGVQKARYATPECRRVALGAVVDAFGEILPLVKDKAPLLALVRRQTRSPRKSTKKRAERLLARWTR